LFSVFSKRKHRKVIIPFIKRKHSLNPINPGLSSEIGVPL
jgi:hypothetical protein